jgi:pyruvate formate-lyase activating enzyme-like uncharacterized protein
MERAFPEVLKTIYQEVSDTKSLKPTIDSMISSWEQHISITRKCIPEINIENGGEALYLGALSPGCQTCKDGTWDCIFITIKCNIACPFCLSPHGLPDNYTASTLGNTQDEIIENHKKTTIKGISFSGGEVFLEPNKLFDWIAIFKSHYPDRYYWLYTNGILAEEKYLRKLGKLGVNEIRFNAAATGYDNPSVMKNIASASNHIPNVTVEIPAIPEDEQKLLSTLEKWSRLGVKYINLHELMYGPDTNSETMDGQRQTIRTGAGYLVSFNPVSRHLTLSVMQKVLEKGYPLSVNDCSLQSKIRQVHGIRKALTPLLLEEHEKFVGYEVYETCCAFRDKNDYHFFHPDSMPELRNHYSNNYKFFRLARTAPVSVRDSGRWVKFEEI